MGRRRPRRSSQHDAASAVIALALILAGICWLGHVPALAVVILLMLACWPIIAVWRRVHRYNRLRACGMAEIVTMTGTQFEWRCVVLFRDLGYNVKHLGQSGDFGADLLVTGQGRQMVVQCKRYAQSVGIAAVQEVHGSRAHYRTPQAAVLTCAHFTPAALRLARETGVECWGRPVLERMLLDAQRSRMRAA